MSDKRPMADGPARKKRSFTRMSSSSRTISKTWKKSAIPRPLKEFTFVRKYRLANLNLGTGNDFSIANDFQLTYLPNVTEFTALFDAYRINLVTVRFDWSRNDASSAGGVVNAPIMYNVLDKDDNNSLAALSDALQYGNCQTHNFATSSTYIRSFVPCVAAATYRSAVSTAYSRKSRQWVDVAQVDVPHYGMKYWVNIAGTPTLDCGTIVGTVTVNFSCKDTR